MTYVRLVDILKSFSTKLLNNSLAYHPLPIVPLIQSVLGQEASIAETSHRSTLAIGSASRQLRWSVERAKDTLKRLETSVLSVINCVALGHFFKHLLIAAP